MPAKRHEPASSPTTPPHSKRQTRSSAKAKAEAEANVSKGVPSSRSPSKGPGHKGQVQPARDASNKLARAKAKASNRKDTKPSSPDSITDANTATSTNQNLLTLTHSTLKNPISCQLHDRIPPDSTNSGPGTLIFTHGAGGTLSAPAVQNFTSGYSSILPIFLFQGSMNLASRVKGFQACISHLDSEILNWTKKRPTKDEETNGDNGERRLLLGGRSMGSRAAVMAALDHITNIDAEAENAKDENKAVVVDLVLCSYPLQGPKAIRDQILLDLPSTANVLFIIGSRDAMCPLDLLAGVRKKMRAQSWLLVVEGMDHGMHGRGKEELGVRAGKAAAEWVRGELVVGKWVRPEWENGERVLQIDESMEGEV